MFPQASFRLAGKYFTDISISRTFYHVNSSGQNGLVAGVSWAQEKHCVQIYSVSARFEAVLGQ